MDDPLYRDEILDHYYASPYRGRLPRPDRVAELDNPFCGDRLRLELEVGPGESIGRVRFDGDGCAISKAAASLLAGHLEGSDLDGARSMTAEGMIHLIGIPLTPARLKCGLLALRALRIALQGGGDDPGAGPEPIASNPPIPHPRSNQDTGALR